MVRINAIYCRKVFLLVSFLEENTCIKNMAMMSHILYFGKVQIIFGGRYENYKTISEKANAYYKQNRKF